MLIRRGSGGAFLATSLDGVIAGLAVAALSAALAERAAHFTHTSAMAAGTSLAYPLGDVLLLVLAIGGLTILPRGFRPFFAVVCVAFVIADIGDTFNLLQPGSTVGCLRQRGGVADRHRAVRAGGLAPAGERQDHRGRVVRRLRAARPSAP